ncbi:hydroquinone glucosyltransferase-like [Abrus precatorius]|uniref:Glycosyltransferase n=1 Tax=Abrus precatorius TaxID=3816 RepID=A0A8B8JUU4_ABRPR|nr:hydroquinone glucosyltransferase-like [Abrus precatorius]
MEKQTHIVIVPSPGFSHLLSIIEFSKRLIHHSNGLHVTCLIPTLGSPSEPSKTILQTLPSTIHSTFLPSIHFNNIPEDTPIAVQAQLTVTHSLPFIRDALETLSSSSNLVAIAADLFASDALTCAKEFNMLSFVCVPSSAMTQSFCLYLPKLDRTVSSEFRYLKEPIEIPGCVPIHGRDLPKPVQDRTSQVYELFLQRCKQLHLADGVLVNSFRGIEAGPIRALTEEGYGYPSVYPIGPVIQKGSGDVRNGCECLRWLENQVTNSVLYISFGSGGTLPQDQLNELALGLEISGKKFLWVLRAPSRSANSAYLDSETDDSSRFLPCGFIERTKEQGLVVPSWAPQVQVLSHSAIGGFLSHCGWNSTLESVMNGVPLIAWPLFAEQGMNAVLLTEGLKVALRPKADENGLVERGEVAKVVRRLLEGEEGREIGKRMQNLKDTALKTLQEEGSRTKTLVQLAVYLMGK